MMDEASVVALSLLCALVIVALAGLGVWARRRCKARGEYTSLDESDYDFDIEPAALETSLAADVLHARAARHGVINASANPAHVGLIKSSKMWVGGANPTDYREPAKTDAVDYKRLAALDTQRLDRNTALALSCHNFCRSLTHTRQIVQALPNIGWRDRTKYYTLVNDALVNAAAATANGGGARKLSQLMCMTAVTVSSTGGNVSGDVGALPLQPTVALDQPKTQDKFRALLLGIDHPHVLPTLDIGFAAAPPLSSAAAASFALPGASSAASATAAPSAAAAAASERWNVFVVREYSADTGSVRDFLHDASTPALLFRSKYCAPNPDPHSLTYPPKDARPLRLKYITRWGRHILLGLHHLTHTVGLPCVHLHTGNVIVHETVARITEYEATALGLPHRYQRALQALHRYSARRDGVATDSAVLQFVCVLYEMCSGSELAPHTLQQRDDDGWMVFALTKEYVAVERVLHRIVNRTPPPPSLAAAVDAKQFSSAADSSNTTLPPVTIADLLDQPLFGGAGNGSAKKALAAAAAAGDSKTGGGPAAPKMFSVVRRFLADHVFPPVAATPITAAAPATAAAPLTTRKSAAAASGSIAIDIAPPPSSSSSSGSSSGSKRAGKSTASRSAPTTTTSSATRNGTGSNSKRSKSPSKRGR